MINFHFACVYSLANEKDQAILQILKFLVKGGNVQDILENAHLENVKSTAEVNNLCLLFAIKHVPEFQDLLRKYDIFASVEKPH